MYVLDAYVQFFFPHTGVSTKPLSALELLVVADRKTVRVEIDRSTIHLLGHTDTMDEESIREFLRSNRKAIEVAIKAHIFARGIPLACNLVLSANELDAVHVR